MEKREADREIKVKQEENTKDRTNTRAREILSYRYQLRVKRLNGQTMVHEMYLKQ